MKQQVNLFFPVTVAEFAEMCDVDYESIRIRIGVTIIPEREKPYAIDPVKYKDIITYYKVKKSDREAKLSNKNNSKG